MTQYSVVQERARDRVTKARAQLFLSHPWFGFTSLKVQPEPAPAGSKITTIATDGTRLIFCSEYIAERTSAEMKALIAHEVMHCVLGHPWRGKGRDWREWNEACDIAINTLLRKEGFELPHTYLAAEEPVFVDMNAEEIYAARKREKQNQPPPKPQGGNGGTGNSDDQDSDGSGGGEDEGEDEGFDVLPAPEGAEGDTEGAGNGEADMSQTDWQIVAQQASNLAARAGQGSADINRACKVARESQEDWRTILRRFIENVMPSDYSWSHPDRRFVSAGIYLPGIVRENTPRIGVAVDTSASVNQEMLDLFASEISTIAREVRPEVIHVVYADSDVCGEEEFEPEDEIVLHAKGGGGTYFQPALDYFSEHDTPPACVIYLTDLEGGATTEPDYPVLWVVPEQYGRHPEPFGEKVVLTKYK